MTREVVYFYDSESTIYGGEAHGPHPMHHKNSLVLAGIAVFTSDGTCSTEVVYTHDKVAAAKFWSTLAENLDVNDGTTYTFVGHNIGFDFKLAGVNAIKVLSHPKVRIWDTMVAEYVLNGQDHALSYTLEATAAANDIEFAKDTEIKEYFAKGLGADHIPIKKLTKYLTEDVKVLPPLFVNQMRRAREQGQERVLQMRMESQKWLTIAEYNGMAFDSKVIEDAMPKIEKEVEALRKALQIKVAGVDLDLTSPKQLGMYIYGGVVEKVKTEPVGLYKNGKIKYGKVGKDYLIPYRINEPDETKRTTTEQKLRSIDTHLDPELESVIECVLEYREVQKELSTYCNSLLTLNMNGWIYGSINTCVTVTGRLSASKPNLQNIKNGRLKAAFVSRYGDDGVLLEVDYSQLEIIALAALSKDEQLIKDVIDGVDIHTALFYDMYHRNPTKVERKAFKPRTFALVYGASAKGIAENAKCTEAEAARFIKTFYERYPGVGTWHKMLKNEWVGQAKPVPGQYPKCKFQHRSPTGLLLTYYTGDRNTFSPTQLVNYPVQSFAADIVQLMIPKVCAVLRNFPGALLVNVVHDSFLIDCTKDDANVIASRLRAELGATPYYVAEELCVEMDVSHMDVGVSIGPNWAEMKEIT